MLSLGSISNVIFIGKSISRDRLYLSIAEVLVFLGCYAHKLNLAIKRWLGILFNERNDQRTTDQKRRAYLICKIHAVAIKLRNVLTSARLREIIDSDYRSPLLDQETRWLSTFAMVKRFLSLEPIINELEDVSVHALMPNQQELREIRVLSEDMEWLSKYMVAIQAPDINIKDARELFNVIDHEFHGEFSFYLSEDAGIISDPDFDSGVVIVLSGSESSLNEAQRESLIPFRIADDSVSRMSLPARPKPSEVLEVARKRSCIQTCYDRKSLQAIPATSCRVERLFSKCGVVLNKHRTRLLPRNFEARMILLENQSYWVNEDIDSMTGQGFDLLQAILNGEGENEEVDVIDPRFTHADPVAEHDPLSTESAEFGEWR